MPKQINNPEHAVNTLFVKHLKMMRAAIERCFLIGVAKSPHHYRH
jgi:hypothetical protein